MTIIKLKNHQCHHYNNVICFMFYFSQPRNQTRKLKTSQPLEKTRYNSKIFYKICPIFDNKEENVSSRSVLLTVSQIILQSFSYFEPKILILLPLCFSEMARPPHSPLANAERHTADTGRHINNVNHRTTNTEHYCTDTFARAEYGCFSEC